MGTTFITRAKGKTPKMAFDAARYQAQYDHGHNGYTGTIAEKSTFVMINDTVNDVKHKVKLAMAKGTALTRERLTLVLERLEQRADEVATLADALIKLDDSRVNDEFSPAGCIKVKEGEYLFFGWAVD